MARRQTSAPRSNVQWRLALKEQRAIRGMEAVAERPDGTRVHFVPYPTPLYDNSGTLIGAVNMLVDISDRKRADLDAQRLASIVESSDDAIISKGLDGIITSWNRGAERLFGYTAEEVIGKPVTILIPEDRMNEEPEILDRIRRGERIDHYDTVRRRKDGSLIDISLTVSPLKDADGRIIGASKIARDITERKRAQEQQKLVVNEMQHRIKNSLATIQAIATQTLNEHAKERDAFIARLHALGSAHDLLTSETWERAPLRAIVTRVLEPFQEKLNERITIDGPDDLWLDSTKSVAVAMALHELATNAVKYGALSNGGGRVTIAWEQCQANRVKLVWQENGGPKVSPPKQKGFGSHLIERAFGGQLGGSNSCSVQKAFLAPSKSRSSRADVRLGHWRTFDILVRRVCFSAGSGPRGIGVRADFSVENSMTGNSFDEEMWARSSTSRSVSLAVH